MFWEHFDHFWSFLLDGDFFQKIQLSLLFGSLTLCQVSEKTKEPILKKLTDVRMDKQTIFYRVLLDEARCPKRGKIGKIKPGWIDKTRMGGFPQMSHILLNAFAIYKFRDW